MVRLHLLNLSKKNLQGVNLKGINLERPNFEGDSIKIMRITFDSNVWRKVSSPEQFPNDPSYKYFKKIRKAIDEKRIIPFLCETVFTLEAIERKNRQDFFSSYKPTINISEEFEGNIATAVAEWADGDSVACHIAVGGDYFCTRDTAKKAGSKSIFSQTNLEWLKMDYDFHVISPEELAQKIQDLP